jgi:lysophospholipase L1-like esterase
MHTKLKKNILHRTWLLFTNTQFTIKVSKVRLAFVFLLTVITFASVTLVGYQAYKKQFLKLQTLRTFPKGEVIPSNNLPAEPHVIMLGDSRLSMWAIKPQTFFSSTGSTFLSLPVRNMAIGGTTSSQTLLTIRDLSWSNQVQHTVIIESGINDIHWLGGVDKLTQNLVIANLKKNITKMSELLSSHGQKTVLMTIWPPSRTPLIRQPFWAEQSIEWIEEVNEHIRKLETSNIIIWDASLILSTESGYLLKEYIDPEFFLHMNTWGYRALREKVP